MCVNTLASVSEEEKPDTSTPIRKETLQYSIYLLCLNVYVTYCVLARKKSNLIIFIPQNKKMKIVSKVDRNKKKKKVFMGKRPLENNDVSLLCCSKVKRSSFLSLFTHESIYSRDSSRDYKRQVEVHSERRPLPNSM